MQGNRHLIERVLAGCWRVLTLGVVCCGPMTGCSTWDPGNQPNITKTTIGMELTSNRPDTEFRCRLQKLDAAPEEGWRTLDVGSRIEAKLREGGRYEIAAKCPGYAEKRVKLTEPIPRYCFTFVEADRTATPGKVPVRPPPVDVYETVELTSNVPNTRFLYRLHAPNASDGQPWREGGTGPRAWVKLAEGKEYELAARAAGHEEKRTTFVGGAARLYQFVFMQHDRLAGTPQPLAVRGRFAVIVGVSAYKHAGEAGLSRLEFARKDAEDFARALEQQGWSPDRIKVLTDQEATKRDVEYALETWLRRVRHDDMIVLFWSAHGWPDPADSEKAYFACYDSRPSDPSSGFRMDQVRRMLDERNARNVVVIADTCHSGKVIKAGDSRAIAVRPALDAMKRNDQIPKGWVFIASADPDRKAYEDKAWANGALTHVLLEGLHEARADGYQSAGTRDGVVTLGELRAYVKDRMAEESLDIIGARLDPLFYTTSGYPQIWDLSFRNR